MSTDVMEQRLADLKRRNEELDKAREAEEAAAEKVREKDALKARIARLEDQVAGAEALVARRAKHNAENPRLNYHGHRQIDITLPEGDWSAGDTGLLAVVLGCGKWSKSEIADFCGLLLKLPPPIRLSVLHTILCGLVPVKNGEDEAQLGVHIVTVFNTGAGYDAREKHAATNGEAYGSVAFTALSTLGGRGFKAYMETAVAEVLRRVESLPEASRGAAAQKGVDGLSGVLSTVHQVMAQNKPAHLPMIDMDLTDEPAAEPAPEMGSFVPLDGGDD